MDFPGFPQVESDTLSAELPDVGFVAANAAIDDDMVLRGRIRTHKIATDVERRATPTEISNATLSMHCLLTARLVRDGEPEVT